MCHLTENDNRDSADKSCLSISWNAEEFEPAFARQTNCFEECFQRNQSFYS